MKNVRYIIFLFLAIMVIFPLKTFWGKYFEASGILYDILWMLFGVTFIYVCNYLYERLHDEDFPKN